MLFDTGPRKEVMLEHGWVNPDTQVKHRRVVVRLSTVDDEIKADCLVSKMAQDERQPGYLVSDTLRDMSQALFCIVEWEGIPRPGINHIRQLSSRDARTLIAAINDLSTQANESELPKNE